MVGMVTLGIKGQENRNRLLEYWRNGVEETGLRKNVVKSPLDQPNLRVKLRKRKWCLQLELERRVAER